MSRKDYFSSEGIYTLLSPEEKINQRHLDDNVVSIVDRILYEALEINASDVHLQPEDQLLRVRYRIDGILYDQKSVSKDVMQQVVSRVKVLSAIDIAEKRIPQDGKFRVVIDNGGSRNQKGETDPIDFRVATFPSIYGEKVVIRILNRSVNILHLISLGLHEKILADVCRLINMPYGFFLITGPTGSGKTTTLYAMLSQLNRNEKNIITMEDPVEYDLKGIMQSQVNEKAGFTFENGLRSMLRQDPDVMMIGEIRDKKTLQIAVQAALTGHLVMSTLHTHDAAGAVSRLLEMGVEPFLINATLTGVLAQRLARKLCEHCKKEKQLTPEEKKYFFSGDNLIQKLNSDFERVMYTTGCNHCFNLGYKGRVGIFELFLLNDNIRRLIIKKSSTEIIRRQAIQDGMIIVFQDGLKKVQQGIISLEELLMVTGGGGNYHTLN